MTDTFGAVLPTYNRARALRTSLPGFLALDGLRELVIVDDGSTDDTLGVLAAVRDPRLRVLRQPRNGGSPAARRAGIAAATQPWLLMLEDDVQLPEDYGTVLLEAAERHSAVVVGAPWVHTAADGLDDVVRARRAHPVPRVGLRTHPGQFPACALETPFLPGLVMVRKDVFERVTYDPGYRGNAWREETSLFLSVEEAGMRCLLTPDTYSYQTEQFAGGQTRSALHYERWIVSNNWRFLRRHRRTLRQRRHVRHGIVVEQTCFLAARGRSLVLGKLRSLHS